VKQWLKQSSRYFQIAPDRCLQLKRSSEQ